VSGRKAARDVRVPICNINPKQRFRRDRALSSTGWGVGPVLGWPDYTQSDRSGGALPRQRTAWGLSEPRRLLKLLGGSRSFLQVLVVPLTLFDAEGQPTGKGVGSTG
jgi:hypothetical protein